MRKAKEAYSGKIDEKSNKDGDDQLFINRNASKTCIWYESDNVATSEFSEEVVEWNIQPVKGNACSCYLEEKPIE